jgi:hypothetical protein
MNEYLNENEKKELAKFVENQVLMDAVKKVLLADIYDNGILTAERKPEDNRNWVFGLVMDASGNDYKQTNEELGEKLRACVEGIRTIQLAYRRFDEFKVPFEMEISKENPAR